MSLNVGDIIALARAGYSAAQISEINAAATAEVSTESTAPSTVSTESTESTPPAPLDTPATSPAPGAEPPAATPAAPAPEPVKQDTVTNNDLMARIQQLESSMHRSAILTDQQPGQMDALTGEKVLARILDPTA